MTGTPSIQIEREPKHHTDIVISTAPWILGTTFRHLGAIEVNASCKHEDVVKLLEILIDKAQRRAFNIKANIVVKAEISIDPFAEDRLTGKPIMSAQLVGAAVLANVSPAPLSPLYGKNR